MKVFTVYPLKVNGESQITKKIYLPCTIILHKMKQLKIKQVTKQFLKIYLISTMQVVISKY
jgi:hypothetical protein